MVSKVGRSRAIDGTVIQFTLVGLVVFAVSLVFFACLLSLGLTRWLAGDDPRAEKPPVVSADDMVEAGSKPPGELPPWGELIAYDVDMDRPDEYLAFEINTNKSPSWIFEQMNAAQAEEAMRSCGLTDAQMARATAPAALSVASNTVTIRPDRDLVLSLPPPVRARLYARLTHSSANHYMQFPFCFPGKSFAVFSEQDIPGLALVRQLLYPRGSAECFSDFELVLRSLPSEAERLAFVKAISRQSAVLLRVRIRPDTDMDRLLGYWGRGVQSKDVRPLLESIQRLANGGTVSVIYLLPKFARDRLYTYPFGENPGDPVMDCHWTTMNFFNEKPDHRFANAQYTVSFLQTNYYRIAQPSLLGDRIFLVDERGNAIHSAVYIADNIVFTKNGNNFTQPWTLMRLDDLMATYAQMEKTPQAIIYRSKSG
jgi:hypothetical protein